MKIFVEKLHSCGVNYQVDYLLNILKNNFSLTRDIKKADSIIILGGCCCTIENLNAAIVSINDVLANKRANADTYLIGCITRGFKPFDELLAIESSLHANIDHVIDHYDPNELINLLNRQYQSKQEMSLTKGYGICEHDKNQANIYLQNGCTHNCTFCKSNYLQCKPMDMPIEKAKRLIDLADDSGIKNLQLRGLNVAQYGIALDGIPRILDICEYIEESRHIEHVELAGFAFADAIDAAYAKRLKYLSKTDLLNGSLESGSNDILRIMNKGFSMEEFWEFYHEVNSIKKKDFYLSIISGFPTETIEDCHKTLEALRIIKPKIVNINTYLDSPYVPSHNLKQLSEEEIKEHTKVYIKSLKKDKIKYMINLR